MPLLHEIIDELVAVEGERTSVGDVAKEFESRGFGPILLIPALIIVSPVGGIPGLPTVLAAVMLIIALQLVWGRSTPWLPKFLAKQSLSQDKVETFAEAAKPWAERVDKILGSRLQWLSGDVAARVVGVVVVGLAALIPPLEIVPFAAGVPAFAIALLALGLCAEDGLLVLMGLIFTAVAVFVAVYYLV